MSRIGKKPVPVPAGVKVQIADRTITVEGPLGKLQWEHRPEVSVAYDEQAKILTVTRQRRRAPEPRPARPDPGADGQHDRRRDPGLREDGWRFRASATWPPCMGKVLQLRVGLANELQVPIPDGVKVTVPDQQHIVIQGIDKQKVGHFAAAVRGVPQARSRTRARASATWASRSAASRARHWSK